MKGSCRGTHCSGRLRHRSGWSQRRSCSGHQCPRNRNWVGPPDRSLKTGCEPGRWARPFRWPQQGEHHTEVQEVTELPGCVHRLHPLPLLHSPAATVGSGARVGYLRPRDSPAQLAHSALDLCISAATPTNHLPPAPGSGVNCFSSWSDPHPFLHQVPTRQSTTPSSG